MINRNNTIQSKPVMTDICAQRPERKNAEPEMPLDERKKILNEIAARNAEKRKLYHFNW